MSTATKNLTEAVVRKIRELPPLPLVVQKLMTVMRDTDCSADDITKVLSSDQALTGMVLKLVNSSFYGMSGQVSTISRAVVILGHAAIRNLALGLGAARILTKGGSPQRQRALWAHAITSAAASEVLARDSGYPDPEETFIAGLLHDIGRVLLTIAVPEAYEDVAARGPADLSTHEMEMLGIDHTRAGRRLLRHWKLPDHLIEAVRFHHAPKFALSGETPLITYVALGDALSCLWSKECEVPEPSLDIEVLAKQAGHDLVGIVKLLPEIEQRISLTRAFLAAIKLEDDADTATLPVLEENAVFIGTDRARSTWATTLLSRAGCEIVPMQAFFADPGRRRQTTIAVLDGAGIPLEQWAKIAPALAGEDRRIYVFADGHKKALSAAPDLAIASLPLVFNAADLVAAG